MVIISKRTINEYCSKEIKATDALLNWYKEAKSAEWTNFSEMKKSFNSVDAVGNDLYVSILKAIITVLLLV